VKERSKVQRRRGRYLAIRERRLRRRDKNVGVESDLLNDLGFNLCVAPQSPVVRLVAYFGVREVAKNGGPKESSEGVGVGKRRLGPDDVNLQTEELHCNYSVLTVSAEYRESSLLRYCYTASEFSTEDNI